MESHSEQNSKTTTKFHILVSSKKPPFTDIFAHSLRSLSLPDVVTWNGFRQFGGVPRGSERILAAFCSFIILCE